MSSTPPLLRGALSFVLDTEQHIRLLQTDAGGQALAEAENTRIGNIGVGTFLIIFFGFIYVLLCCFGKSFVSLFLDICLDIWKQPLSHSHSSRRLGTKKTGLPLLLVDVLLRLNCDIPVQCNTHLSVENRGRCRWREGHFIQCQTGAGRVLLPVLLLQLLFLHVLALGKATADPRSGAATDGRFCEESPDVLRSFKFNI